MKRLQLEDGKPVVRKGPFGTDVFTLNKNIKDHVVHLVCVHSLRPFVGWAEDSLQELDI